MKTCSKCKKEFPATPQYFFRCKTKSSGLRPDCKACRQKQRKEYYDSTRETHLKKMKEWYVYYKEHGLKRDNITEEDLENKKIEKEKRKKESWKKTDLHRKDLIKNNKLGGYILKIKSCTGRAWRNTYSKKALSFEALKCDHSTFKKHLIGTFEDNYSIKWQDCFRKLLHIDHVTPLGSATTREEVNQLAHFTNTQFLFSKDNCIKSTKLDFKLESNKKFINELEKLGIHYERIS